MNGSLEEVIETLTNDRDKFTMGEAVRMVRKARKWQQKYLAKIVGISNSYLCDIEKNRVTPSIKTIQRLGQALMTDVEELDWQFFLQFDYVNNGKNFWRRVKNHRKEMKKMSFFDKAT